MTISIQFLNMWHRKHPVSDNSLWTCIDEWAKLCQQQRMGAVPTLSPQFLFSHKLGDVRSVDACFQELKEKCAASQELYDSRSAPNKHQP